MGQNRSYRQRSNPLRKTSRGKQPLKLKNATRRNSRLWQRWVQRGGCSSRSRMQVIAVSDSTGGIYCTDGLIPEEVLDHKEKTGSVQNYKDCKNITNEELLELPCDVLIPAAMENQITYKNADKIKAKMVAEGANGPTTPEADKTLYEKGICLIPDILLTAAE